MRAGLPPNGQLPVVKAVDHHRRHKIAGTQRREHLQGARGDAAAPQICKTMSQEKQ
jgi:hypothetical protein